MSTSLRAWWQNCAVKADPEIDVCTGWTGLAVGRLTEPDGETTDPATGHLVVSGRFTIQYDMRKQYHFRPSDRGLLAWDVDRLVRLTTNHTPVEIPLSEIRELDETFWFCDAEETPTCRRVADHARLINETDLRYPIILSQDGGVMDGMHRVCKALIQGLETISAVTFEQDPEPDYVGYGPDDLPYDEETEP